MPLDFDGAGLRILPDFLPVVEVEAWFGGLAVPGGVSAHDFPVFGVDAQEGYGCTAFWLARAGASIEDQPVVSIGPCTRPELLAPDLGSFLWALADVEGSQDGDLLRIARPLTPERRLTWPEAQKRADDEFPDFSSLFTRSWDRRRQALAQESREPERPCA